MSGDTCPRRDYDIDHCKCNTEDDGLPTFWFPTLPGDQPNERDLDNKED